jgi:transcriptional regulator with XRE-family HTH domain
LDALAGSIGVTVFAMRDYELGVSRISAEHLWRICRALEAPPSFFFESGSGCSGRRRITTSQDSVTSPRELPTGNDGDAAV